MPGFSHIVANHPVQSLALLLAHSSAFAYSIFTVGPGCPYTDIQTAVDAAASTPGADYVFVSNDLVNGTRHNYTGQHIHINDTDGAIIEGGFISCFDPDIGPADTTTISGAGNGGGPVFDIQGDSNVYLGNLVITGAQRDSDQNGGGIGFYGHGSLTLANATITQNGSGTGAGIGLAASGGHLEVAINDNVLITFNTAQDSGGGLHIEGDTTVTMDGASSLIGYNHALAGYGGGLAVNGPSRVNIGSPGYGGLGVIYSNDANWGGGVAAFGIGDAEAVNAAVVKFYTTDPQNPVRIQGNFARYHGGAFYAKGHSDESYNDNHAFICATQFRIDQNAAPDGAVAYMDWDESLANPDVGSELDLNTGCAGGGVRCAAGVPCNTISDNVTEDSQGTPTQGAIILSGKDGVIGVDGLDMRRNRAGFLFNVVYSDYYVRSPGMLHNCLLADNQTTGDLLHLEDYQSFTIDNCTIAGNAIGGWVFDRVTTLNNSLIVQPGVSVGTADSAQYVLSTDIVRLQQNVTVRLLDDPRFADASHGDYHLRASSPAVDYAGGIGGYDLDGLPRDLDLPGVPNKFGPRDLGAYELQQACGATDTIFCDNFDVLR